jgi:hypothetical protein
MFTLTDNEKDFIVKLYRSECLLEVDKLPYTSEFDNLHASFERYCRPVAKNVFWQRLLALRKDGTYGPQLRRHPARKVAHSGN